VVRGRIICIAKRERFKGCEGNKEGRKEGRKERRAKV